MPHLLAALRGLPAESRRGGLERAAGSPSSTRLLLAKLHQHLLRHGLERVEDAVTRGRGRLERRLALEVQLAVELLGGHRRREVTLVELQDVGNGREVEPVLPEVLLEVLERLDVRVHARFLRVRHEDDAVDALEDELAARVVEDLTGDRVEVEACLEAAHGPEVEREEVEEQGPVRLRRERDELPLRGGIRAVVDVLQVRRLAAEAGAVIDDLAIDLAGCVVDERHPPRYSRKRLSMSSSVISAKGES